MTSSDVPAAGRPADRIAIRPLAVRLHVRRHPTASLGRWPATRRLVAVIVVAVLVGAAAGGLRVASAVSAAAGYARTTQLAVLGQQVTVLAFALENERDATAAFVAASGYDSQLSAGGITSRIVAAPVLLAYQAQMKHAEAATDAAASRAAGLAARIGGAFPAGPQSKAAQVVADIRDIPGLRSGSVTGTSLSAVQNYSAVIADVFALDDQISAGSGDSALGADVSTLGALSRAQDQASQQRAILTAALLSRQFAPGAQQALATAQALESADLLTFQESATTAQENAFVNVVNGSQAAASGLMTGFVAGLDGPASSRGALLSRATPVQMNPASTPNTWYTAMSSTLDRMQGVGLRVAAAAVARGEALHAGALRSAELSAAVTVGAAIVVLLLTLFAARSASGDEASRGRAGA